jgi:hypothetical protein
VDKQQRESANNMLKLKLDWRPARLMDLVNHLFDLVKLQYTDLQRAMYGLGNYELVSPFTRHHVSMAVWDEASPARKQLLFDGLMSVTGNRPSARTITSTDGEFTVVASPKVAKKPGQRKRARAERSAARPAR